MTESTHFNYFIKLMDQLALGYLLNYPNRLEKHYISEQEGSLVVLALKSRISQSVTVLPF